jgi:hypothetical protein
VAGYCEHSNEISSFKKLEEFLEYLLTVVLHECSSVNISALGSPKHTPFSAPVFFCPTFFRRLHAIPKCIRSL